MAFDEIIVINGLFSLLFVLTSATVGIKIALKYFEYKVKNLLLVGLCWLGISMPWWGATVGFISYLMGGPELSVAVYFFLSNVFLPIFLLGWLVAMSELLSWKRGKLILLIFILISVIFDVLIIYFSITNPSVLGTILNHVDIDYEIIPILYLIFILVVFLSTGFLFAIKSIKSDSTEIRLKGKLIIIAFSLFFVGAFLDILITFPQNRILLMLSAILFYLGFLLPDWLKNRLLNKE